MSPTDALLTTRPGHDGSVFRRRHTEFPVTRKEVLGVITRLMRNETVDRILKLLQDEYGEEEDRA